MCAKMCGPQRPAARPGSRLRYWICSLPFLLLLTASSGFADPPPASVTATGAVPRFHLFPTSPSLFTGADLGASGSPVEESSLETPSASPHRLRQALRADGAEIKATGKLLVLRPWGSLKRHPVADAAIVGALYYSSAHKRGIRDEVLEDGFLDPEAGLLHASSRFGEWQIPAAATVGLYLGGLAFDKPAVREGGLLLAETMLYTAVATGIGQSIFAEDRPERGGKLHYFRGPAHGVSGHASFSVALTQPLMLRYLGIRPGDGRWVRAGKRAGQVVGWSIPLLTGLSRIEDDKHFLWNVLAGWGIGYYVSDTVWKAHVRRTAGEPVHRNSFMPDAVSPWVSPEGGGGMILVWHF